MKKAKSILALLMAVLMLMSFGVTGFAIATEEEEENGSAKDATAFGFGTEIKGTLSSAEDVDYYSFTNKEGGLASVTISHLESPDASKDFAYFEVTIYDSTETEIISFLSTGADEKTSSPSFSIDPDTVYYVKVEASTVYSESFGYSLTASFDKGAYSEKEPNNLAATATNLELSTKGVAKHYYGTISAPTLDEEGNVVSRDVDYYRVAPTKAGVIYIYLYNGASKRADYKATLYTHDEGKNGVLRAVPITSVSINSNQESVTSVRIGVDAKEYMLKVEGLEGSTGGYRTRVYFAADSYAEKEYNSETNDANLIKTGSHILGTISDKNDVDYYKFVATAKNNDGYKITLGANDANAKNDGSWYVTLYDGSTIEAAVVDKIQKIEVPAGKATEIKTSKLVEGRTYYIKVEGGATLNTELYKISIAEIPAEKKDEPATGTGFLDQIKAYIATFAKNFEGWFEQINVMGIVSSITSSVVKVITMLISSMG